MADDEMPEPQTEDEALKQAEELLRQEKERHEQLLDKLGDALGKMLDRKIPGVEDK